MSELAPGPPSESTHAQRRTRGIVASAMLVGGGSLVSILCGAVRSKVVSLVAGPAGIGLQGLMLSTLQASTSIASVSFQTSGVREIARLRGASATAELGHTLRALRLATFALGGLAAVIMVMFQRPLAAGLLDDAELGWAVMLLGIAVFAQVLYSAYSAFLRGFRRVASLTLTSIVANVVGTVIGVGVVVAFGIDGVVSMVTAPAVCLLVTAMWSGRDYARHFVPWDRARVREAGVRVIRIGVVLATTGVMATGTQLATRLLLKDVSTLDDVGFFQAAWSISTLYLGFVLGAMGQDYYPRLAEMREDRPALTEMVNDQAKISFLLAGPAILGVLAFSGPMITLLYSSKFTVSVEILRWQLLGDVIRIGSWTLGYLVLAQGRPRVYFLTELSFNAVYLLALIGFLPWLGVMATAVAYVAACVVYLGVLCLVANRLVGFAWTRSNIKLGAGIVVLACGLRATQLAISHGFAVVLGGVVTAGFGVYCLRRLLHETGLAGRLRRESSKARR